MGTTTLQWHTTLPLQQNDLLEVTLDGGMARPIAIPRPMSRQKVSYMTSRYLFGNRDIRYLASIAIFHIDTTYRTVLLSNQ